MNRIKQIPSTTVKNLKKPGNVQAWVLLLTSIVLLTVGIYGTVVSSEYSCDNGINIKLNDKHAISKLFGDIPDMANHYELPHSCSTLNQGSISKECVKDLASEFSKNDIIKCMESDISNVGKLDRCLNDHGHGDVRCMEGGMMAFSIIAIIVGALMLIWSMYSMFK